MLLHLTLLSILFLPAYAGDVTYGQPCSIEHQRLEEGTYQFYTDCDAVTYCNSSSLCDHRGCRKDTFPYGYAENATLPNMCDQPYFCPDEEDQCLQKLLVGSPCQFNRDDQCQGPSNFQELADTTGFGLNVNGSVCLNNVCMYANRTLGEDCVLQNTVYVAFAADGSELPDIISRDNCVVGLYCDAQALQCMQTRDLGATCDADKECSTYNCLASGVCGASADTPQYVAKWVYAIVAIGIVGGVVGTLVGMYFVHKKHSAIEREKRLQYWKEQAKFRDNIVHMQETTRNSMLFLSGVGGGTNGTNSARTTLYGRDGFVPDDSHTPILQGISVSKSSALRYPLSDDSSNASAEQLVQRGFGSEKRF